jgi:serpin B
MLFVVNCETLRVTAPVENPEAIVTTTDGAVIIKFYNCGRDSQPNVAQGEMAALVNGNTAFAIDLYKKVANDTGNIFFSPYSVSIALAMTWGGAKGETATDMASALHFTLPQTSLHNAFDALDLSLAAESEKGGFALSIVNQLWGEKTSMFLPDYLKLTETFYGAPLRLLDFINNPDPSRIVINSWVSDQTNGRIQDLLPGGSIKNSSRLVLTNAIYFKAQWADTFSANNTCNQTFYSGQSSFATPFIHQKYSYHFFMNNDYRAIELPYKGNDIAMDIILPDTGKMALVEAKLSPDFITGVIGSLQSCQVDAAIPKFKFSTPSIRMKDMLASLGMAVAFDPRNADFSGIDGTRSLCIGDVIHKAFVAVDEKGTEAAAATAVVMRYTSSMQEPIIQQTFYADHPFIFLIRDVKTGAVLFMGKVTKPVVEG